MEITRERLAELKVLAVEADEDCVSMRLDPEVLLALIDSWQTAERAWDEGSAHAWAGDFGLLDDALAANPYRLPKGPNP